METALQYAVRRIKESVPRMVLEKAFMSATPMNFGHAANLDTAVELAVLRDSVCKDVQAITSITETIDLTACPIRQQPHGGFIVDIPPMLTGGRPILSVDKFCFFSDDTQFSGLNNYSVSAVDARMNAIMDAHEGVGPGETTRCRMITPNQMVVDINLAVVSGASAVVNLEVDDSMSHVPTTAYDRFARMAVEKAKQLAYNNLTIALAEGVISRGIVQDTVTNVINNYTGSDQNYNDLLSLWRRSEIFFDHRRMREEVVSKLPK